MNTTAATAGSEAGIRCIRCGSDLSGLADSAPCPGCSLAVLRSRHSPRLLRNADRTWVRTMRLGLRHLELAMEVVFAGVLVLVLMVIAVSLLRINLPAAVRTGWVNQAFVAILLVVALALHVSACWRLGAAERSGEAPGPLWRHGVRFAGLLMGAIAAVTVLKPEWLLQVERPGRLVMYGGFQALAMYFFFAVAAILEHVERRTLYWDRELQRRHRGTRRMLVVFIAIVVALYWVPVLTGRFVLPITIGTANWGMVLFGLVYMVFAGAVGRARSAAQAEEGAASGAGDGL
jgi:hypothetical protein